MANRSGLLQANIGNGWFDLPTPTEYDPTYTHLENSYTNASGYLVRDIVRKNRAKVNCSWEILDADDVALLQTLYDQKSFKLRFTDNFNRRVVKKVYAGPQEGKTKYADPKTYMIVKKGGITMNFIEF